MAYNYNNSILSNVYNYYQSGYSVRSSSRYDAHNRSDLKNVYKSIVNMSKDSPVFLLKDIGALEKYSIHMKESAIRFRNTIASLGGLDESTMFGQRTVYSSDPSVVQAEGLQVADDETVSIVVEDLAREEETIGRYLKENELDLMPGAYSFDVATSSSNFELQFNISESDTNRSIQSRLARLINHSNLGMTASVSSNRNGESALMIRSNTTGTSSSGRQPFMISDENTSQKKGIVDYLGLRDITNPARNAKYSIDGRPYQSSSNSFNIDNKYSVTLKGIGGTADQPVVISTKPDYESLKDNILTLTGSYNNFLQAVSKYLDQQPRTSILIGTMKQMSAGYSPYFTKAGITQDIESGMLAIDQEQLTTTLGGQNAAETLDSLKSFTHTALKKANQIQLNPLDYIDKRIVAYKNPNISHYANPYVTSAYSGMLFNGYM